MPDLQIQGLSEQVLGMLKQKAQEAGMDTHDWLRQQIIALASLPSVKSGMSIICKSDNGASIATITRSPYKKEMRIDAKVKSVNLRDVVDEAGNYLSRDQPGDVEHALKILKAAFEEVLVK